jgi:septum formation protein
LARAKAQAIARHHRHALVIGSDQLASWRGEAVGKPGNFERALIQLEQFQGETVMFYSAVCVVDAASGMLREDVAPIAVTFRRLSRNALEAYLRIEEPYDCAGSAKSEGLGIALIERIDSDDPTALVGLPLIRLVSMLTELGYPVLAGRPPATAP